MDRLLGQLEEDDPNWIKKEVRRNCGKLDNWMKKKSLLTTGTRRSFCATSFSIAPWTCHPEHPPSSRHHPTKAAVLTPSPRNGGRLRLVGKPQEDHRKSENHGKTMGTVKIGNSWENHRKTIGRWRFSLW